MHAVSVPKNIFQGVFAEYFGLIFSRKIVTEETKTEQKEIFSAGKNRFFMRDKISCVAGYRKALKAAPLLFPAGKRRSENVHSNC